MVAAVGRCGGGVVRDAVLSEGISPVGWAFGLFCVRGGVSKGSSSPRSGAVGCFASEAEFSKGYRRFASVITLAKRGIAVKVEVSL